MLRPAPRAVRKRNQVRLRRLAQRRHLRRLAVRRRRPRGDRRGLDLLQGHGLGMSALPTGADHLRTSQQCVRHNDVVISPHSQPHSAGWPLRRAQPRSFVLKYPALPSHRHPSSRTATA